MMEARELETMKEKARDLNNKFGSSLRVCENKFASASGIGTRRPGENRKPGVPPIAIRESKVRIRRNLKGSERTGTKFHSVLNHNCRQ